EDAVPERLIGDPLRLRQVLVNLVGNAIKFTEQGEVVVEVSRIEARASERGSLDPSIPPGLSLRSSILDPRSSILLQFSITDTGIGIPASKLEAIFQPFEQADGSLTRKHGGTGLGLAIVSRLVELMGGRVWVQ